MLNTRKVGLAKHVLQSISTVKRLFSTTHAKFETQQKDDKNLSPTPKTWNDSCQKAMLETKITLDKTDIKQANKQMIEERKKYKQIFEEVQKKICDLTSSLKIEANNFTISKILAVILSLINMVKEKIIKIGSLLFESTLLKKIGPFLLRMILYFLFLFLSTISINLTSINNLKFWDFEFSFPKLPLAVGFLSFFLFLRKLPKKEQFGAIGLTLASLIGSEYVRSEDNRVGSAREMFQYLIENHDSSDKMAFSLKLIDRYSGDFNTKQDIMDNLLDFLQHYYSFFTIFKDATVVKTVDKIPSLCVRLNGREKLILPEIFVNLEDELKDEFFEIYFKIYFSKSTAKYYLLIEEYLRQKESNNTSETEPKNMKDLLKNLYENKSHHCFFTYTNTEGKQKLLVNNFIYCEKKLTKFKELTKIQERERLSKKKPAPPTDGDHNESKDSLSNAEHGNSKAQDELTLSQK